MENPEGFHEPVYIKGASVWAKQFREMEFSNLTESVYNGLGVLKERLPEGPERKLIEIMEEILTIVLLVKAPTGGG